MISCRARERHALIRSAASVATVSVKSMISVFGISAHLAQIGSPMPRDRIKTYDRSDLAFAASLLIPVTHRHRRDEPFHFFLCDENASAISARLEVASVDGAVISRVSDADHPAKFVYRQRRPL
jgi:hypothetical protein